MKLKNLIFIIASIPSCLSYANRANVNSLINNFVSSQTTINIENKLLTADNLHTIYKALENNEYVTEINFTNCTFETNFIDNLIETNNNYINNRSTDQTQKRREAVTVRTDQIKEDKSKRKDL